MSDFRQLFTLLCLGLILTAPLVGCGEEEDQATPEESLESSLDQAESSIDQLRQESGDLADEAQSMQNQLQETAKKQMQLYGSQIGEWRKQVAQLPVEAETEFRGRLDQLEAKVQQTRQALEQYTQQDGAAGGGAWDKVAAQLEELKDQYQTFTDDLAAAKG